VALRAVASTSVRLVALPVAGSVRTRPAGIDDPRWLLFRAWLLTEAPDWLRETYIAHGESFAGWIHDKPVMKAAIRVLMDQAIASSARSQISNPTVLY
jgi:hypothetical protein